MWYSTESVSSVTSTDVMYSSVSTCAVTSAPPSNSNGTRSAFRATSAATHRP